MKGKWLTALQAILIALVILAGSIAAPILCRPFYYLHIEPLKLQGAADLTTDQIKTAYNEMMDFCVGLTDEFSTGELGWTEEGRAHFADVRKLFLLDLWALVVSAVLLVAVIILRRKERTRLAGQTPGFWAAMGLGVCFVTVGGLAALDFDKAFVVFHKIFFPGKDNWLFDPMKDQIIRVLPAEFFRNCAILILGLILVSCSALVIHSILSGKKK